MHRAKRVEATKNPYRLQTGVPLPTGTQEQTQRAPDRVAKLWASFLRQGSHWGLLRRPITTLALGLRESVGRASRSSAAPRAQRKCAEGMDRCSGSAKEWRYKTFP